MALQKEVNGKLVDLTAEEEAAVLAERAAYVADVAANAGNVPTVADKLAERVGITVAELKAELAK